MATTPVLTPDEPAASTEKPLDLKDAKSIAIYRARSERRSYVIWWVMNEGYISLPEGTRPKQFYVTEEFIVLPTYGE
jgi:hypothetical protein